MEDEDRSLRSVVQKASGIQEDTLRVLDRVIAQVAFNEMVLYRVVEALVSERPSFSAALLADVHALRGVIADEDFDRQLSVLRGALEARRPL